MAEWTIMCAKQLGVPCEDTPQRQDWSPYGSSLEKIESMQRRFRVIIRRKIKVDIAGCYAVRLSSRSKLVCPTASFLLCSVVLTTIQRLASEWAVLPDFKPITIDSDHFGMTKLGDQDPAFKRIAGVLNRQMKELAGVSQIASKPKRWALLIGIDYYLPGNHRPVLYSNLHGCVQDVLDLEEFLMERLQVPVSNIAKLVSPVDDEVVVTEDARPFHDNVIRELERITKTAARGDTVYIHYSGHCTRRQRIIRLQERGQFSGIRLALADVMTGGAYLTDYQLVVHVKKMVAKGLHVAVVVDSSYHGKVERRDACAISWDGELGEWVDNWMLRSDECADSLAKEADLSDEHALASESLVEPPYMCTVLAARSAPKSAPAKVGNGFLTRSILQILQRRPENYLPSYSRVRNYIAWRLSLFRDPVLYGDGQYEFFGNRRIHQVATDSVVPVLETSEGLQLAIGSAQGVAVGATYEVLPNPGASWWRSNPSEVFTGYNGLPPEVRVTKVSELRSQFELVGPLEEIPDEMQPMAGSLASLLNYALPATTLVRFSVSPAAAVDVESFEASLQSHLAETPNLGLSPRGWVGEAAFNVLLDENYEFVIQDEHKQRLRWVPRVSQLDGNDVENLACVLRHLARFRAIARAEYSPSQGTLDSHNFHFRLEDKNRKPLSMGSSGTYEVMERQEFLCSIANLKDQRAHFAVFSLNPVWEIMRLHPYQDLEISAVEASVREEFAFGTFLRVFQEDSIEQTIRAYIYVGDNPPTWDELALPKLSDPLYQPHGNIFEIVSSRDHYGPLEQLGLESTAGKAPQESWCSLQFT
ncbi:hypothetical protein IL306_002545, partial [Fusarium sp. DS 682]